MPISPSFPTRPDAGRKRFEASCTILATGADQPENGWKAALDLYQRQRDDLHAGRKPRDTNDDGLTVRDLCNRFLTSKQHQLDTGEITNRTFLDYKAVTDRIVKVFDKNRLVDDLAADDFEELRAGHRDDSRPRFARQ